MKEYKFDHYYVYEELTELLSELSNEFPGLIKVNYICNTLYLTQRFLRR